MNKGDIILVPFPYTDLTGSKRRPAFVLFSTSLDVTVCFISTQIQLQESSDILLSPQRSNGLKKLSLIRLNKIATIDRRLVLGRLGSVSHDELFEIETKLLRLLQIKL